MRKFWLIGILIFSSPGFAAIDQAELCARDYFNAHRPVAVVAMVRPERATPHSDGLVLTPRVEGFDNLANFNRRMGAAIDQSEDAIAYRLNHGMGTDAALLWRNLQEIGNVRHAVESERLKAAGKSYQNQYGVTTNLSVEDYISKENRFRAFYDRAEKFVADAPHGIYLSKPITNPNPKGTRPTFPTSGFIKRGEVIAVIHPNGKVSEQMRDEALEILARATANPKLTAEQFLIEAAKAHFLMMHGTPFENGSPACVLALVESIYKAKYHKSLGRMKPGVEIFWKAIFLGAEGEIGYQKFVREYPSYFEPGK